jgi:hypothetical protein
MLDAASTPSTLEDGVKHGSEDPPLQKPERVLNTGTLSTQRVEGRGEGESE